MSEFVLPEDYDITRIGSEWVSERRLVVLDKYTTGDDEKVIGYGVMVVGGKNEVVKQMRIKDKEEALENFRHWVAAYSGADTFEGLKPPTADDEAFKSHPLYGRF